MTILQDVQGYEPGQLLNLYEIDFSTTGLPSPPGNMHLYPGIKENFGDIIFGGYTYTPYPMEITGFKKASDGPLPRPVMSISNVTGFLSQQMLLYNDFIGAKVSRHRTFAKYLDGQPAADPSAKKTEIYFVEQKKSENRKVVQLELVTAVDIMNATLPSRVMFTNTCMWAYKGTDCGWPATNPSLYFDDADNPVQDSGDDVCGKRLDSCKRRFGAYIAGEYGTPRARLPFGAFPALGKTS